MYNELAITQEQFKAEAEDRRRVEETLRETKDHLNNIIESSIDCIMVSDRTGYITMVNKYFLDLLGYEAEEAIGKHVMECTPMIEEGTYECSTGEVLNIGKEFASLSAFDNLIRTAVERRVDFVVLAGDIYDGEVRGTRAQIRFLAGLRELDKHGIQCFFIHGNHDPVEEGWSALRREDFPASTIWFSQSDQVVSAPTQRNGEIIAVVHGISFRTRHETRNLSRLFPDQRAGGPWHVGLLHCNVGAVGEHDNYAPCTTVDLCSRGMDYWALGHIHKRQVVRQAAPCILYPGNLQARGFDECGKKGATLVRVHPPAQLEL